MEVDVQQGCPRSTAARCEVATSCSQVGFLYYSRFSTPFLLVSICILYSPSIYRHFRATFKLYDTLLTALEHAAQRPRERRAVIVVSDGEDGDSVHTLADVITRARVHGVPLFPIGIGTVHAATLQHLAHETGGQFFTAPAPADLEAIYLTLASMFSHHYTLAYETSTGNAGMVSVQVRVQANNELGEDAQEFLGCPP